MIETLKICTITGFEPFSDWKVNPSREIARSLDGSILNGYRINSQLLSVKFENLKKEIELIFENHQPHLLLMLGLSPSPVIRLEKIAINWTHARIKYNDGSQPRDQLIVSDAPLAYFTDLPVTQLEETLRKKGIPCVISPSAGSYACNQAYFLALHLKSFLRLPTKILFIHVPPLPEEVARKGTSEPSMSLELSLKAVRLIIESLGSN